ncbi:MAG: hypothetical protein AB7O59_11775 [Pirellulales bacterium]
MNVFRRAIAQVVEYRRAYAVSNALYYGLVVAGMLLATMSRETQAAVHEAVNEGIKGPLSPVVGAYESGVVPAAAATFLVNLLAGSLLVITLPSLLIPFSGLLVTGYRAVLWGIIFAPTTLEPSGVQLTRGLLIAGLIFLEGQGYVLAALAAYVQGKGFLLPASVGASSRWQGYRIGLRWTAQHYLLVAAVLAVAAVYEALLVVVILPGLK